MSDSISQLGQIPLKTKLKVNITIREKAKKLK